MPIHVVTEPLKEMMETNIKFKLNGKPYHFVIACNIKKDEVLYVIESWLPRTNKVNVESLIKYINTKSFAGFHAQLIKKTI